MADLHSRGFRRAPQVRSDAASRCRVCLWTDRLLLLRVCRLKECCRQLLWSTWQGGLREYRSKWLRVFSPLFLIPMTEPTSPEPRSLIDTAFEPYAIEIGFLLREWNDLQEK